MVTREGVGVVLQPGRWVAGVLPMEGGVDIATVGDGRAGNCLTRLFAYMLSFLGFASILIAGSLVSFKDN